MSINKNIISRAISVTVIIPSYNSHKTIGWTIKGIKSQTKHEFIKEIIVVDSSDDGITPDFLGNLEDGLMKVTRSGSRVMPAIQRNIGAGMAKGDLLCFVDSDAFPASNWLEIILEEYSKGCLAGGGSYMIPEFQMDKPIVYAQYFLEFSEFIGFGNKRPKSVIPSCNLFCDRELFNKVGGFPKIRASEDSFLSMKINNHYKMMYLPKAIMYHIFRENTGHFLSNQRLLGKYIYIYRREKSDHLYYKSIFPYIFIPGFLLIKITRSFVRVLRTNRNNVFQFFKSMPLIISGLMMWGKGFLEGVRDYEKEVQSLKA